MILGLDPSSTFTGWAIYDKNDVLKNAGQTKMGTGDLALRSIRFFDCLFLELGKDRDLVRKIIIEDTLLRHHRTNAKTLKTLNQINAMITFGCWIYFPNAKVLKVDVQSARREIIKREGWVPSEKMKTKEWLHETLKEKYQRIKGSEKWRDDATDAIVLGSFRGEE